MKTAVIYEEEKMAVDMSPAKNKRALAAIPT
jgi:hypothetical protein